MIWAFIGGIATAVAVTVCLYIICIILGLQGKGPLRWNG